MFADEAPETDKPAVAVPPFRRAQDRSNWDNLATLSKWVRRGPRTLVAIAGAMAGALGMATGAMAWLGAQQSSPGQRITRLQSYVEAGLDTTNERIDTLATAVESLRAGQAEATRRQDEATANILLLLRINCRPILDIDLRQNCIDRGARR